MTNTKRTNVEATTQQETPMPSEDDNGESQSGASKPETGKNEENEESQSGASKPETGKNEENEESQSGTETGESQSSALDPETGESQSGAFNPETGEINWDCPCLGGMAKGPCGEQFKAAFSCFIYSTAEPKGVDCLEQFQQMKDCFRQHPDEYSDG
jgi:intermembrane space import and assembly protein 40